MRTEGFRGALLSVLVIASLITPLLLLSPSPVRAALTPHDPIYIDGNAGFTKPDPVNGGGSGIENDPYIIENYIIDASTGHGIEIRNTTAYFVIRNCVIENGGSSYRGIYLRYVVYGRIDNNLISNNDEGISLDSSDNNLISNNTCEDSDFAGIRLGSSDNNLVENNLVRNNFWGISLNSSDNNLVENNLVEKNYVGILLSNGSDNNFVTNNTVENNRYYGITLSVSSNNTLRGNVLRNNAYGFQIYGWVLDHYRQDIDNSNTIDGKPIYYLIGESNLVFDGGFEGGFLGLVECENIRVENLQTFGILFAATSNSTVANSTVTRAGSGIYLFQSRNYLISNNLVENNEYGINLRYNSSNNLLSNNIVRNNYYGIVLYNGSDNNFVTNNTVENNSMGIDLDDSDNNLISNNIAENNYYGIDLSYSDNNLISNNLVRNTLGNGISLSYSDNNLITNNIVENKIRGIYLSYSDNNLIYHNNFVNNTTQATDDGSNYWDDGYPSGGNYWSDYMGEDNYWGENQDILGSDGIGDTPYNIPYVSNQDRYPLMNPWPVSGTAVFSLENLYKVSLEKDLWLYTGSKLVVKFYNYSDAFENENVIENFTTPPPWHVEENEGARHPEGIGVKKVRLDLTTDDTENVISTITSFTVRKVNLEVRFTEIPLEWLLAPPAERTALEIEFSEVPLYWLLAPS